MKMTRFDESYRWLISRFETDFDPKSIILRWIDCNMTHFDYSLSYFSDKMDEFIENLQVQ